MSKYMCFLFGHKYFVAQKLTSQARRVCCHRCSKSYAMNDDVRSILDWDSDFHRLYEGHGIKIDYLPFEFSKINNY